MSRVRRVAALVEVGARDAPGPAPQRLIDLLGRLSQGGRARRRVPGLHEGQVKEGKERYEELHYGEDPRQGVVPARLRRVSLEVCQPRGDGIPEERKDLDTHGPREVPVFPEDVLAYQPLCPAEVLQREDGPHEYEAVERREDLHEDLAEAEAARAQHGRGGGPAQQRGVAVLHAPALALSGGMVLEECVVHGGPADQDERVEDLEVAPVLQVQPECT
mmetsp:Transcript_12245/g.38373  ORF Transcript_12245/g.38373 Transcript_12245/m.38373 type:complete len:218 (-) Transcript_12245:973-1626(-)